MCRKVGMRTIVLQPYIRVPPIIKSVLKLDTLSMNSKDHKIEFYQVLSVMQT
jgi:hypothetical protein